jgi:hypothetical protein
VSSTYRDHDQILQSVRTLTVFDIMRGVQFDETVSSLSEAVVVVHDALSHFTCLNVCIVQRNKEYCPEGSRESSVGIAAGWTFGVRFPARRRDFFLLHSGQTSGVHPAFRLMGTVGFSPRG